MGVKLCVVAGCMNVTAGSRCTEHERAYQRARNADPARKPRRTTAYLKTVIPAGAVCVCCGSAADLTRHHPDPLARRATHDAIGELWVMCRRCNSSIGTRVMADNRCPMHGGEALGG